jgi:hypothetical protein
LPEAVGPTTAMRGSVFILVILSSDKAPAPATNRVAIKRRFVAFESACFHLVSNGIWKPTSLRA